MNKYYVSTKLNNGGLLCLKTLSPRYETIEQAKKYFWKVFEFYDHLYLREESKGCKKRTILEKNGEQYSKDA